MSREEDEQQHKGFKVEDRRRFSETGDARPDAAESPAATAPQSAATVVPSTDSPNFEMRAEQPSGELNFSTFMIGLCTQALVHLGEMPDPMTNQATIDLTAARQMIDILGMLQQKTRGNLDKTEADLLEGMLYDLRLRYVERAKR
jgi:hypothetical protein